MCYAISYQKFLYIYLPWEAYREFYAMPISVGGKARAPNPPVEDSIQHDQP